MKPNDLIEVELGNGKTFFWRISGVYLGAENQESVVHLIPLDQSGNTQGTPTLVPAQMLDAAVMPGCAIRHHAPQQRTEKEAELLNLLMEANEALRSCNSIIERRGENTNWEGLHNRIKCELANQHRVLRPLRFERIQKANDAMSPDMNPHRDGREKHSSL